MIVLIAGEKGGTGKTTLTTSLAALQASKTGRRVLIVDADKQGTSAAWAATRAAAGVDPSISCVQVFGTDLPRQVQDQARNFDDVLIDAGGRDSVELRGGLMVADKLFSPITTGQFDAWALRGMRELLDLAEPLNPKLNAFIVINKASPNPMVGEADEIRQVAHQYKLKAVKIVLHDRIAHRSAAREGLSAAEYEPKGKAASELLALHRLVFAKLKEA